MTDDQLRNAVLDHVKREAPDVYAAIPTASDLNAPPIRDALINATIEVALARAVESGLVEDLGGGRYRTVRKESMTEGEVT